MIRANNKWVWVVAGSIGLNLFLLGALAVHLFGSPDRPRMHAPEAGGPALLRQMVHTLGGPDDPRVKVLWEQRRSEMRRFRSDLEGARAQVAQALAQEPFDGAALRRALAELNRVQTAAHARSSEGVIALAEQLTTAERQRLRESPSHAPRRGRGPGPQAPLSPPEPVP